MEREFLEGLELNGVKLTKELVEQIMAENDKDIQREQAKVTSKETELATAQQTIKDLEDAAKKFEGTDPEQLKQDLANLQKKYDEDLTANKRNSALDLALVQAKARDLKAAKALLNMEEIKLDGDKLLGFDSQLEALKKDKAWLFEGEEPPKDPTDPPGPPAGPTVKTGGSHGGAGAAKADTLASALSEFYSNN